MINKMNKITKGGPSGLMVSLAFHAAAFLLAGMLVVFSVVKKEEQKFVPPKPVERPKMKLKKPKVKVKKSSKPKVANRIVTKVKPTNMPDIRLPEMSGLGGGLGGGDFSGLEMIPAMDDVSVFGGGQSIGSDFEGEVYSLLHTRSGGAATMDSDEFRDVLRKYVLSGWKDSVLARYYRSPKKMFSTHIMIPPIPTAMAPGVFGVPELEDYYLFIKYEGKLVYREDIRFRFWGIGDAYIFVNVGGEEVLMSSWQFHHPWFGWWSSTAGGDRTHILGNQRMVVGDWIELKAGEPVDMKVLFGEWQGGAVSGMLLVEVEGVDYPTSRCGGPLLPAFKTADFTWETLTEISRFLAADECTLTNGPVFNDYHSGTPRDIQAGYEPAPIEPEPEFEKTLDSRVWTTKAGKSFEGHLVTAVGGKAVLKNARKKQVKLPLADLSDEDRDYIRLSKPPSLDINFSKKTDIRKFGDTYNGNAPPVRGHFYTFKTTIKQTSTRPYGHPLTAEFFAIGDEIGGDKHILLDYQKSDFTLNEANDYTFTFSGKKIEMLDYTINGERKGKRYGGFLVIVKDCQGRVVAYETPSENLYRNVARLRQIKPGWYFDKTGVRCLPTPPEPHVDPGEN